MAEEFLLEREGLVAIVTLARPDRMNAVYFDLMLALADMFATLERDEDVGAIVLTGAGRAFCAGGDVKLMDNFGAHSFEWRVAALRQMARVVELIRVMPKIVIAAVNGAAVGAGFTLAAACDMRVASDKAQFCVGFSKVGLSGDMGGSHTLPRLIGPQRARDLYYTNRTIGAEEALRIGLVNEVVPHDECLMKALERARDIAQGPRLAVGYMKRNMLAAETESFARMLDIEAYHQQRCAQTEDHAEAKRAIAEKRAPVFKGK